MSRPKGFKERELANLFHSAKQIRDQETGQSAQEIADRVLNGLPLQMQRLYRKALIQRIEIYDG